jgi:hypothetical protein
MTDKFVTLHQLPIDDFHPTIEPSTYEEVSTLDPPNKVELDTLLPGPILHPGPTTTLGPTTAVS